MMVEGANTLTYMDPIGPGTLLHDPELGTTIEDGMTKVMSNSQSLGVGIVTVIASR